MPGNFRKGVLPFVVLLLALEGSVFAKKPNIVVILADDLGYADVGFHGCKDIPTPNLDVLAASGVRCSSGYSSHPYCSPMRAGLMACRYQHRFGYVNNVAYDPQNTRIGLPESEKTIASRLQAAGYSTGMVGKWHLGASHKHHPNKRGFDFFYGFLGGGHQYFEVDLHRPMGEGYWQPLDRNGEPENFGRYLTDALTKEAVKFIERQEEKPFFLYVAYNAPHTPLQARKEDLAKFEAIGDKRRRAYAAMVYAMDRGVGEVVAALEAKGVREETVVFFLSDNGGPTAANASSNVPLRGFKGDVFEGGIRVPFVVSWPGKLVKGSVYRHPVISIDISRTALELGGAKIVPKLEGTNLVPFLTGKKTGPPHEALFWASMEGAKWAARAGDRKLLLEKGMSAPRLYDLADDIGEQSDLSRDSSETVNALRARYEAWDEENTDPIFPGFREYHRLKGEFYNQLR